VEPPGLSPLAAALMGMIGALLVFDLLAGRRAAGGARPGRAARDATGGIGRFARTRTRPPARLW
jgi:hypothetical protein